MLLDGGVFRVLRCSAMAADAEKEHDESYQESTEDSAYCATYHSAVRVVMWR